MDFNSIVQLVGTLGFPIVACGAMYVQLIKQADRHKEEMDKIREALENNTKAILELTIMLRKEDSDGGTR